MAQHKINTFFARFNRVITKEARRKIWRVHKYGSAPASYQPKVEKNWPLCNRQLMKFSKKLIFYEITRKIEPKSTQNELPGHLEILNEISSHCWSGP